MCRGKEARVQRTHSGLRLARGDEYKDKYTQLERRILGSFCLITEYSIVQSTSIHRVLYSSDQSFHLNTLRGCQPSSQWAI